MEAWDAKFPVWRTDMINDLHRQPPPTMKEQIAARMQAVQSEMLELDRQLIQSQHFIFLSGTSAILRSNFPPNFSNLSIMIVGRYL